MITRQLSLNVTSLSLPRELNEAARKRERYSDSTHVAQELLLRFVLFSLKVYPVLSDFGARLLQTGLQNFENHTSAHERSCREIVAAKQS
jgi:hypothetical protein